MSISFGQQMQSVATKLISKYGDASVTFSRNIRGDFDPTTGSNNSDTSVITYTTQGVSSNYRAEEVNSTTILYTDLKYVIKVTTMIPQVNDTVILNDNNTYRVMSVSKDDAQNIDICYTLQLRI